MSTTKRKTKIFDIEIEDGIPLPKKRKYELQRLAPYSALFAIAAIIKPKQSVLISAGSVDKLCKLIKFYGLDTVTQKQEPVLERHRFLHVRQMVRVWAIKPKVKSGRDL